MKIIAGVDEVGRGSLIGPVYAAAVILNRSIDIKLLKDSKSIKTCDGFFLSFMIALFIASKLACNIFIFSISLTEALPTAQIEFFLI